MAGGNPRHAALTLAVGAALLVQLRGGPCRAFSSDLRVRVLETGLSTYPDVTVVCGPLEHDASSDSTVTNPRVVVEVPSRSTEAYDLGEKFDHYARIPSLAAVLYVSQTDQRIELRRREPDGSWSASVFGPGDVVAVDAIGCSVGVDDVYRDAPLQPPPSALLAAR